MVRPHGLSLRSPQHPGNTFHLRFSSPSGDSAMNRLATHRIFWSGTPVKTDCR